MFGREFLELSFGVDEEEDEIGKHGEDDQ